MLQNLLTTTPTTLSNRNNGESSLSDSQTVSSDFNESLAGLIKQTASPDVSLVTNGREKGVAAQLNQNEVSGDSLPQGAIHLDEPLQPELLQITPLEGEALISYLMANAGTGKSAFSSATDLKVSTEEGLTSDNTESDAFKSLSSDLGKISNNINDGQSATLAAFLVEPTMSVSTPVAPLAKSIRQVSTNSKSSESDLLTQSPLVNVNSDQPLIIDPELEGQTLDRIAKDDQAEPFNLSPLVAQKTTDAEPKMTDNQKPLSVLNATDDASSKLQKGSAIPLGEPVVESEGVDIKPSELKTASVAEAESRLKPMVDVDNSPDRGSRIMSDMSLNPLHQKAAIKATTEGILTPAQQELQQAMAERPMKMANAANALSERVSMMIRGELQNAVIRLDPPELGALEVRVQVQQDQTQVQIISQSAAVREALEQQSARLRDGLAQQGLALSNMDVSDQSSSQSDAKAQGEGQNGSHGQNEEADDINELDGVAALTPLGLVDQYV